LTVGLISYLLIAPNTTIMRLFVDTVEPMEFTFLRSALIVLVSLPFILLAIPKLNKRNLTFTLGAGLCMSVAAISLVYAVKYSNASYAVVMGLIAPILLVILSSRLMKEKVTSRAAAGVAVAAVGALVIVGAPLFIAGGTDSHFYPLATALMLANSLFFTLGTLLTRKAHETGLPLMANSGMMSIVILAVSFTGMYSVQGLPTDIASFSPQMWIGVFYSGVIVVFLARVLNISSYERIGSAALSSLSYVGTIVGVLIPVVFLGEKLSNAIIIGGILIFAGVYLTERHRAKHHKYVHPH